MNVVSLVSLYEKDGVRLHVLVRQSHVCAMNHAFLVCNKVIMQNKAQNDSIITRVGAARSHVSLVEPGV
jgi:hypothetical protein